MSEMIRIENLTKRFGQYVAVRDVSFSVEQGSIFGFLGPNGSGKSTVIRMLCGLLEPSGGEAWLDGINVKKDVEKVKRNIGYMSQSFSLYGDLSVEENLSFYGRVYGLDRSRLKKRMGECMELSGITSRRKQLARTLSGGWKQRLALACSMLHEPRILFLDEPTAGIDPLAGEGVTVFVTTHYMDEALNCGRIVMINEGKIVAIGNPGDIIRETFPGRPEATLNDVFIRLMSRSGSP